MFWSGHSESNLLRPSITFSTLPEPCQDLLSAMRRRVSAFVENCREQWRWQSGGQCGPCVQQCGKRASQSGLNSAIKSHLSKLLRVFLKVGTCICQSSFMYLSNFWPRASQGGFNSAIKPHVHICQSCYMYLSKLWQKRLSDGHNSTTKSPPVRRYHSSTQISLATPLSILLRVFVLHFTTIKMRESFRMK